MSLREAEVDYVIVGTGAGGASAARVLAEAGLSLVLLEEGPALDTRRRPQAMRLALRDSFRDFGTFATRSAAPFPVLQGRLVGGSTAINSAIIWRLPEDVRALWRRDYGLESLLEDRALDDAFERLERELCVAETPADVLGRNGELMAEACRALGLPGRPIRRNVRNCGGSARCLQGCPRAARQSMDVTFIPFAVARGAQLWPLCRAEQLEIRRGRAVGVRGRCLDPDSRRPRGRFRVRARRGVILAAGAVHTPLLLHRAGLRGMVGQRFQAHPGSAVAARFDEPVHQGTGATQSYEVPLRDRGYKIESLSLPPELLAARLPGAGRPWQERVAHLGHYAHWVTQVRMQAHGSVRPGPLGQPVLRYQPLPQDWRRLRESVALIVRMFFAAGAREVSPGVAGLPEVLTEPAQAAWIQHGRLGSAHFHLLASHLFGTASAGEDPRHSVVAPNLECHAVRRLFVMDASALPTNLGCNPQHTICALAWRAAQWLT